jgi:hypothetical protein
MPMEHAPFQESSQSQGMSAHHMAALPKGKAVVILIATFACLAAAVLVTSFFAEIRL